MRRLTVEIVHHVPNSIDSNFIVRAQQIQATMALSFQTVQVFFNGKYNYHSHVLCKKLIATKDKSPLSLLARRGECFVSHRISSFRLDLPLLCDLNIKPIIFSPIVRNPHRCFSHSLPPPVICVSLVIIIAYWKRCGWL